MIDKKTIYLAFSLLVIPLAQATPAMLATDVSYADILVASAAASKVGAEVYYVNNDTVPEDIYSALQELSPEQIYIIGGPAVVSENLETNLSQSYNVTRIWGMTRYGTAAEVAKYFWPEGVERAVLVRDDIGSTDEELASLVARAKDIAVTQQIPLLLIPQDSIPSETEEAIKELGVKEVYLIGEIEDSVKDYLNEIGINIIVEAENEEEVENIAIENAQKLVIVAVSSWKDLIAAPFVPNGVAVIVRGEEQIPSVVDKVKTLVEDGKIDEIKVVGIPWLAEKICSALASENIEHECITGKRAFIAKKLMKKLRERIRKLREEYHKLKERIKEKLEENDERIKKACEIAYEKAKSIIESFNETEEIPSTIEARYSLIEALKEDCDNALQNEEYFKAFKIAREMRHETDMLVWQARNILGEEINEEIQAETRPKRELMKRVTALKARIEKMKEILEKLPERCRKELRIANELANKGEYKRAMEKLMIAKRYCEIEKIRKLRRIAAKEVKGKKAKVCIQVLTPAVNPKTNECKVFPTPCDVPEGWKIVRSCRAVQVVKQITTQSKECAELAKKLRELRSKGASSEDIQKIVREIRTKCISPIAKAAKQTTSLPEIPGIR